MSHRYVVTVKLQDRLELQNLYNNSLSRGVLFVTCSTPPPLGAPVKVELQVGDDATDPVSCEGAVYYRPSRGMGSASGCGIELRTSDGGFDKQLQDQLVDTETPGGKPPKFESSAVAAVVTAVQDEPGQPDVAPSAPGEAKLKALVVEDDPLIQEMYAKVLGDSGFEVVIANHGLEAIELFNQHAFALMVVDYLLPRLDGFKVVQQTSAIRQVPIIFASAMMKDPESVDKLRAMGVRWFLEKPFRLAELRSALGEAMREAKRVPPPQTTDAVSSAGGPSPQPASEPQS